TTGDPKGVILTHQNILASSPALLLQNKDHLQNILASSSALLLQNKDIKLLREDDNKDTTLLREDDVHLNP
ncbi:hypothetical protein T484DRAFT_1805517, partial [Baffinella frigidus]